MEAIDLGLDWNFHAEINSTEQKIQHKTELRYAILVFAAYPAFAYCTFDITSDDETANITARTICEKSSIHVDITDMTVQNAKCLQFFVIS
jgi:hypothetical protein